MTQKKTWTTAATLLADLFLLWVIVEYVMGGWQLGLYLLTHNGLIPWLILPGVLLLLLYRSDYRTDRFVRLSNHNCHPERSEGARSYKRKRDSSSLRSSE